MRRWFQRRRQVSTLGLLLVICGLSLSCTYDVHRRVPARLLEGAALAELPETSGLVQQAGGVFLVSSADDRYRIARARETSWLEIETRLGTLRTSWDLPQAPVKVRAQIPEILAHAEAAALDPLGARLSTDVLTGLILVAPGRVVVREGVAPAVDPEGLASRSHTAHERARARLASAIQAVVAVLPEVEPDMGTRRAARDILGQLDKPDSEEDYDLMLPSFARRLVRHGWLQELALYDAHAEELEAAVRDFERLLPVALFESDSVRIVELSNAIGRRVRTLSSGGRATLVRASPKPAYYATSPVQLMLTLPPGPDPLRRAAQFQAAALYAQGRQIAAWSEDGFQADASAWRAAFPIDGDDVERAALADALPPHLPIVETNGDVIALITAHGTLRPATSGAPGEAERFYAEAARVLPDAAHLDLIGEYLLAYAYDSPDSGRPGLVGTRSASGDIHQTALETLDTHTGGMYRGDCDDLSELYQVIAQKQGRNAHLIGLPAHAALAWAERGEGGVWRTHVLQTGRPLVFEGQTLPRSLDSVYRSFGSGEVLDLTKLEVLLRFSGENTRSSWFLSHRIFSDAAYARTMLDIQKDWHFQTYQRAIEKVKQIIASGDQDAANYTELAGLYRYTGQYAEAAESLARAIERAQAPETHLSMSLDRALSLFDAKSAKDAREVARQIRDVQIPALEEARGSTLTDPRLSLVDLLQTHRNDLAMALDVLAYDVVPRVEPLIENLTDWIESDDFDADVFEVREERARYQLRWFAVSAVEVLHATAGTPLVETGEWKRVAASAGAWLRNIAFVDVQPSESVLSRYAVLGRYYEATLGEDRFDARVRAAAAPERSIEHRQRETGEGQIARDLGWIASSPSYWMAHLATLFARDRKTLDDDLVRDLAARVAQARERAAAVGQDHARFDDTLRNSRLIAALASGDMTVLRTILSDERVRSDRRTRMEVSSWIAGVARFVPVARYRRVLQVWREELNYKPMYFWIAWSAALTGATDQALAAAELAASEYSDDPAFQEEYDFMKQRFALAIRAAPSADTPKPTSRRR